MIMKTKEKLPELTAKQLLESIIEMQRIFKNCEPGRTIILHNDGRIGNRLTIEEEEIAHFDKKSADEELMLADILEAIDKQKL
jgi:hypothetical protein